MCRTAARGRGPDPKGAVSGTHASARCTPAHGPTTPATLATTARKGARHAAPTRPSARAGPPRAGRATPTAVGPAPAATAAGVPATTTGAHGLVAATPAATACLGAGHLATAAGRATGGAVATCATISGAISTSTGGSRPASGGTTRFTTHSEASRPCTGPPAALRPFFGVGGAAATDSAGAAPCHPPLPAPSATSTPCVISLVFGMLAMRNTMLKAPQCSRV